MKTVKEQKLIDILESEAEANGFELVDVEFSGSGHSGTIRVFLDKEGGLTLDDIVVANKWVDGVVESDEPFAGSYTLEVSSPGIDRPLRTREHFERFVGEEAKISSEKVTGRANWTGILKGVAGDDVLIEIDGETHRIPMDKIKKAHLKGRIVINARDGEAEGATQE
ncbi:MAG TPA: ribosome maturation factor [Coriobacteriia bacterium]|nr:ribosome maturation factor [Coriobacteriia bacterium]